MTQEKAVIYARTSKKTQSTERQVADLIELAKRENYEVVKIIEEQISGSTKNEKRKGISELLEFTSANPVDIVLTTEVSRLGRSPFETYKIVEALTAKSIPIYFQSYRIFTLLKDSNGENKRNPLAMILFNILSEFAFMEKQVLVERINSGLDKARRNGVILGRKKGTKESEASFMEKYSSLADDLKNGISLRKCMATHQVSKNTVVKVKKLIASSKK